MRKIGYALSWIFFIVLTSPVASGCLNTYHRLQNGLELYEAGFEGVRFWESAFKKEWLEADAERALAHYDSTGSLLSLSDYATSLVYLGNFRKAVNIFSSIEEKSAGLYNTASNIGTAYELLGMLDSAYYWIKKGIELNPESHDGSEWVHLKILEYKLAGKEKENGSVLDLDFGSSEIPVNMHHYNAEELKTEIIYQIKERTFFVKPPDYAVGSLYYDVGNLVALGDFSDRDYEQILQWYDAAFEYGLRNSLFLKRYEYLKNTISKRAENKSSGTLVIGIGLALIVTIAGFLSYRFLRRRKEQL